LHVICAGFNEIRVSYCGKKLAAACYDPGQLIIWDLSTYQILTTFKHDCSLYCLDFSQNGKYLASSDAKGVVNVWNLEELKKLKEFNSKIQ